MHSGDNNERRSNRVGQLFHPASVHSLDPADDCRTRDLNQLVPVLRRVCGLMVCTGNFIPGENFVAPIFRIDCHVCTAVRVFLSKVDAVRLASVLVASAVTAAALVAVDADVLLLLLLC